jgi:hypothetical protein
VIGAAKTMNTRFLLRLVLDGTAAGLLLAALAYYWLDNTMHECIGTGMFLLVAGHNILNRRWYGRLLKMKRDGAGRINILLTLLLLLAMLVLLASSLLISRTVFAFLSLDGGFTARQVHMLAAYWVVLIVSIHIGMRWSIVMGALRNAFGFAAESRTRAAVMRVLTLVIALQGVNASLEMAFAAKLFLRPVLDMWDFNESAQGFFLNYLSIIGLYAALAHYATLWIRRRKRVAATANVGALQP